MKQWQGKFLLLIESYFATAISHWMCDTSRKASSFKKARVAAPGRSKTDTECLTKYSANEWLDRLHCLCSKMFKTESV